MSKVNSIPLSVKNPKYGFKASNSIPEKGFINLLNYLHQTYATDLNHTYDKGEIRFSLSTYDAHKVNRNGIAVCCQDSCAACT